MSKVSLLSTSYSFGFFSGTAYCTASCVVSGDGTKAVVNMGYAEFGLYCGLG